MFFISKNISPADKLQAVKEYLSGNGSYRSIAKKYGITATPFKKWVAKYKAFGESAFIQKEHKSYSSEFKLDVVMAYLSGKGSYYQLAIKYKIPTQDTIRRWVLKYNGHIELKDSETGGTPIMTNGRKTTLDERVEIVRFCIPLKHNYAEAARKYNVSYQQARNYTLKYETNGIDGLKDNRGRRKSENELTELERLRAENKILRAEKERAEMEVSF